MGYVAPPTKSCPPHTHTHTHWPLDSLIDVWPLFFSSYFLSSFLILSFHFLFSLPTSCLLFLALFLCSALASPFLVTLVLSFSSLLSRPLCVPLPLPDWNSSRLSFQPPIFFLPSLDSDASVTGVTVCLQHQGDSIHGKHCFVHNPDFSTWI